MRENRIIKFSVKITKIRQRVGRKNREKEQGHKIENNKEQGRY